MEPVAAVIFGQIAQVLDKYCTIVRQKHHIIHQKHHNCLPIVANAEDFIPIHQNVFGK